MPRPKTRPGMPPREGLALNPWTREQESILCDPAQGGCGALPGHQCVTNSGTGAPLPHAYRFNAAKDRQREYR